MYTKQECHAVNTAMGKLRYPVVFSLLFIIPLFPTGLPTETLISILTPAPSPLVGLKLFLPDDLRNAGDAEKYESTEAQGILAGPCYTVIIDNIFSSHWIKTLSGN